MKRGSATSDDEFAYFTPYNTYSMYRYKKSAEKWDELPTCPYRNSTLVIIDGALTAVGGWHEYFTNKLVTLRRKRWVKDLPPMKTARSSTAVVSACGGEYVVVIGGGDGSWITSVELFQVRRKKWSELTDLPKPLTLPTATICGNVVYVIGSNSIGFSCSIQDLPSSDEPTASQSRSHAMSWSPLPPLPVTRSTAITFCTQLVIIGGEQGGSSVNSINQLVDGQWVEISSMSTDRRWCLVVSLSPNKIMIVGGYRGLIGVVTDSVEECVVV